MARYIGPVCKFCRRENMKLFLKGERCMTAKCSLERRAAKRTTTLQTLRRVSVYISQLRQKQRVKLTYGILERQFHNYFKKIQKAQIKGMKKGEALLILIERRLDNVIYRAGYCSSRKHARQTVNHGHVYVNNRRVNIPSFLVKENDIIEIKTKNDLKEDRQAVEWLEVDAENRKIKVLRLPRREEIDPSIEEDLIVSFYSR